MLTKRFRNLFLQQLGPQAVARLNLRLQEMPAGSLLQQAGEAATGLYFLEEGFCSATVVPGRRQDIEVAVTGIESAVGLQALWDIPCSFTRTIMRSEGYAYFCSMEDAQREADRREQFQTVAMRHISIQLTEAWFSAACNATHSLEQRVARWLLICADKAARSTLTLSQQLIADMIGSTRPTVSEIASNMKREGIIEYSRGTLSILDRDRLRACACDCYAPMASYSPRDPYVYVQDKA